MYCKISIALLVAFASFSPAQAQLNNSQRGAFAGGTAGAVIGGIIGNQNDETSEGAIIGGAVGAIAGGLLGNQQDRAQYEQYRYQEQAAYQQQQAQIQAQRFANGLSVNDVVALSQTGVSEPVIIQQIQQHGIQQQVGVDEIILLHQQGVNNNVISAMQTAHFAGATPSKAIHPISPAPVEIGPAIVTRPIVSPTIVVKPRPVVVARPSVVIAPKPIVVAPRYTPKYVPPRSAYGSPRSAYGSPAYGSPRSAHGHRGGRGHGAYRR